MLLCLMLSERSLHCYNFLNLFFFLMFWFGDFCHSIFQITCAFFLSPSLLFLLSSVFFISVIVFFIFDWLFYEISSSLLKFPLGSSTLFSSSISIFITNALNSWSGKLFIPVSSGAFSGFSLIILFKVNSCIFPFCLIFSKKLGEIVTYSSLERASLYGKSPIHSACA